MTANNVVTPPNTNATKPLQIQNFLSYGRSMTCGAALWQLSRKFLVFDREKRKLQYLV
jgi:hypothetical protein